jgi:glycine cleavage system aminomethyltransferase T
MMDWLDRYIFFADKVELTDVTQETATFSLIGPKSNALVEQLGGGAIIGQPYASHQLVQLKGVEVRIAVGSGLSMPGYTLIVPTENAATVWSNLVESGSVPLGDRVWEQLRINKVAQCQIKS